MSQIKEQLKKSIFGKVLYDIRDCYRFPNTNSIKIKNNNAIILLGTPTYNNIGDHLIALASLEFLKEIYPKKEIIEIPTQYFVKNKEQLKNTISKDIPVFILGGGWMGNIWEDDEYRLQDMLKTFKNNKITILPQTVWYDFSMENAEKVLNDAKKTYSLCDNLTIFFRDKLSYDFGKKNFLSSNIKLYLAPDIALYKNINCKNHSRQLITICLRKDREMIDKDTIPTMIKSYCNANNYSVRYIDTVINHSIPIWYRKNVIRKIMNAFSKSSLVITDRLHGMIIASLVKSRCIAFDNKTKKVSGVYKLWLKNNKNIVFIEDNNISEEKLYAIIDKLLKTDFYFDSKKELLEEFKKMKVEIEGD